MLSHLSFLYLLFGLRESTALQKRTRIDVEADLVDCVSGADGVLELSANSNTIDLRRSKNSIFFPFNLTIFDGVLTYLPILFVSFFSGDKNTMRTYEVKKYTVLLFFCRIIKIFVPLYIYFWCCR